MVNHRVGECVNGMAYIRDGEGLFSKEATTALCILFAKKHLDVDEFGFRWNQGNCQVDTLDRMGILCQRMVGKQLRYKE